MGCSSWRDWQVDSLTFDGGALKSLRGLHFASRTSDTTEKVKGGDVDVLLYPKKKQIPFWLFDIAMEHCPFTDDFPIKTSIYNGFSIAMSNNQMVPVLSKTHILSWCYQ